MNIGSRLKVDINKLKSLSLCERIEFICEYYGVLILAIAILMVILITTIVRVAIEKEVVLAGIAINADVVSNGANATINEDLLNFLGFDSSEAKVDLKMGYSYQLGEELDSYANSATLNVLVAEVSSGFLDFAVGDEETMIYFAYSDFFCDLSKILTEEQIEKYSDYFLYVDEAVLRDIQESLSSGSDGTVISVPKPSQPELMEKPIPVLIDLSKTAYASNFVVGGTNRLVFGITANYSHATSIVRFVDYLF